ncbi:MAG: hypothetical protein AABY18_08075 [Candidatus Thermoplasmatota archaeon]
MILQRIASGLVFLTGLALLRLSVAWESWPALAIGLAIASVGLAWLVLGGSPSSSRAIDPRMVRHG